MSYSVDNNLMWNNIFMFKTDLGNKYVAKFEKVSQDIWTLDFYLESGESVRSEIFKTMKVLGDNTSIFLNERNINTLLVYISGKNKEEIDQKTKVFTRWIKSPWNYDIIPNPIITIDGKKNFIQTNTNFIHITRGVEESIIVKKYCFNCGVENKDYKFCPSCGTNLQQT